MLDLVGPVEIISAHASNPLKLPGGMPFYRRWHMNAGQAQIGVTLKFSFASGFTEHSIHVRGSLASATADFERNTYVLHQHTQFGLDFDRYRSTVSHANALRSQARRTFSGVVLSKLRRSIGSPYGQSIANSIQSFYANLGGAIDGRLSAGIRAGSCPNLHRNRSESCGSNDPSSVTDWCRQCESETWWHRRLEFARKSWLLGQLDLLAKS